MTTTIPIGERNIGSVTTRPCSRTHGVSTSPAGATNHIAFGCGIHFCLGARWRAWTAKSLPRSLTQRFPKLHLESNELRYKCPVSDFLRQLWI
jgi:cytochrome P450